MPAVVNPVTGNTVTDFSETYFTANGGLKVGYDVTPSVNVYAGGQWYLAFTDEEDTAVLSSLSPSEINAFDTASEIPIVLGVRASFRGAAGPGPVPARPRYGGRRRRPRDVPLLRRHRPRGPGSGRGVRAFLPGGVVDESLLAAAVEGVRVGRVERQRLGEAAREIGVGQEEPAVGDEVGPALRDGPVTRLAVVSAVQHHRPPEGVPHPGHDGVLGPARPFVRRSRLHDVEAGDPQLAQPPGRVDEGAPRVRGPGRGTTGTMLVPRTFPSTTNGSSEPEEETKMTTAARRSAEAEAILSTVEGKYGFRPNLMQEMVAAPAAARMYLAAQDALEDASLTPARAQAVQLAVAAHNDCGYCTAVHRTLGGRSSISDRELQAIEEGDLPEGAEIAPVVKASRRVLAKRGWLDERDQAELAGEGVDRQKLVEIVGYVALETLPDYVNHIAGTELDPRFR